MKGQAAIGASDRYQERRPLLPADRRAGEVRHRPGGTCSRAISSPRSARLAVDLSINPNTVIRAYRELEIEGVIDTHQGSGTFVGNRKPRIDELERQRMLDQILTELLARASGYGFTLNEVLEGLRQRKESGS